MAALRGDPARRPAIQTNGEIWGRSNGQAAFQGSRVVLSLIFIVSIFTSQAELGWAALIGMVFAAIGLIISGTFFLGPLVLGARGRVGRNIAPWFLILVDAALALGIILAVGADSAPLAWVALVIPVTEAALAYGFIPAAVVWVALSLTHIAFVVSTNSESTPLTLALQQLLAVLLVAIPAAFLANSVREQIGALTSDRERARDQIDQLETVAVTAEKMTSLGDSDQVLRRAVTGMAEVGFEQTDIVVQEAPGHWRSVLHHHQLSTPPVPAKILAEEALAANGVTVMRPESPDARQQLHSLDMAWGCAQPLDTYAFGRPVVMRAWRHSPIVDEDQTIRTFNLLSQQVKNIYTNSVATEQASVEAARLAYEAAHDPLTGVANHGNITSTLQWLTEEGHDMSVFFVDLDRFKPINDTLGHESGNQALIMVSSRLTDLIGDAGTVGRMGGDEFVVVGPTSALTVSGDRYTLAGVIAQAICEPMSIDGRQVSVGASVGATSGGPDIGVDELLRRADVAMYAAKRGGGGALVWDASIDPEFQNLADRTHGTTVPETSDTENPLDSYLLPAPADLSDIMHRELTGGAPERGHDA